jgi:hypothetical protein
MLSTRNIDNIFNCMRFISRWLKLWIKRVINYCILIISLYFGFSIFLFYNFYISTSNHTRSCFWYWNLFFLNFYDNFWFLLSLFLNWFTYVYFFLLNDYFFNNFFFKISLNTFLFCNFFLDYFLWLWGTWRFFLLHLFSCLIIRPLIHIYFFLSYRFFNFLHKDRFEFIKIFLRFFHLFDFCRICLGF